MLDAVPLHTDGLTKLFRQRRKNGKRDSADKPGGAITALADVSLELTRGEIYGLLGPNGCGKSTLVRIVSTLMLPDRGSASVFGCDVVRQAHLVRRLVNRVSVDAAFFKKLSPAENLLYAARLYGLSPRQARERAIEILEALGFPLNRLHDSMENLSRGQQQKVAIARGLFTSPVLLLLDEPTTGLDPRSKHDVEAFLRSVNEAHDATILFTTHDMAEADALCHRIAIMDRGRIIAEGTSSELKDRVRSDEIPEPTLEQVFMELTGRSLEGGKEEGKDGKQED